MGLGVMQSTIRQFPRRALAQQMGTGTAIGFSKNNKKYVGLVKAISNGHVFVVGIPVSGIETLPLEPVLLTIDEISIVTRRYC